jgi:hypothetical protein
VCSIIPVATAHPARIEPPAERFGFEWPRSLDPTMVTKWNLVGEFSGDGVVSAGAGYDKIEGVAEKSRDRRSIEFERGMR